MKKQYNPPRILRNQAGISNKIAYNRNSINFQDRISGVPVDQLVNKYGSPLFVFSEAKIRDSYRELTSILKKYYPNSEVSWSYKTNYLGAICSILHQEGAKAEIVSIMEYEMAKHLGIAGEDIIFNGPGKRKDDLLRVVEDGVVVHIDHFQELIMLEEVANELNLKPRVAIRINMDTGIYPQWQRFGFNYENGEAYRTLQRLLQADKLELVGLHAHIGTFMLDATPYYVSASKLLELAQRVKDNFGVVIEYIDLGGGFASKNTLHNQYTPGEFSSPSFDQYATAISKAFNESKFAKDEEPRLILETGRVLVDEAGTLITSVLGKKDLPTGERAVIIDAGVNILFTTWWYNLKVLPAQPISGTLLPTVFYGPLCMNIDIVKHATPYPDLRVGDRLLVTPVGAYNVTQWMQFIEYRPGVCLISEQGETHLIREREELSDVNRREKIPEYLRII